MNLLMELCPPPAASQRHVPKLPYFKNFNLECSPPEDLSELYSVHGVGSFHCESNAWDLFEPTQEGPEELAYLASNSDLSDCENVGCHLTRYFVDSGGRPKNMILWGHDSDGNLLASMKWDAFPQWGVALIGSPYINCLYFFKSATDVLYEIMSGTLFTADMPPWTGDTVFKSLPRK